MRTLLLTLTASIVAFAVDFGIATVSQTVTRVPQGFPPFSLLPVLSGTLGGNMLASITYAILRLVSRNRDRVFFFVTLTDFTLSLALPLRLSFTRSDRFAGVTPSAQMVLVLMHAIVAVFSFTILTIKQKP